MKIRTAIETDRVKVNLYEGERGTQQATSVHVDHLIRIDTFHRKRTGHRFSILRFQANRHDGSVGTTDLFINQEDLTPLIAALKQAARLSTNGEVIVG